MTVNDCRLIHLERHPSDRLGNLSVVESGIDGNFDIRRVFFIYDVPGGESRGGHAHRKIKELIVAAGGSFSVTLDDGHSRRTILLNHPYVALLVEPEIWLTLDDFSSGAVALVLTSDHFTAADHIKDYQEFIRFRNEISNTIS